MGCLFAERVLVDCEYFVVGQQAEREVAGPTQQNEGEGNRTAARAYNRASRFSRRRRKKTWNGASRELKARRDS